VTDNGGATNTKTQSVTVSGGGGGNVLQNGTPVTGLAATTGNTITYTMSVPAGASNLVFQISGGTGDADMYVRFGSPPGTTSGTYDCRPYLNGNNETCTFAAPSAGTWYVTLRAYSSFTGVTPKYIAGNAIQSGVVTNDITAFKTKKAFATTTKGPGTVDITGTMTLTAPTSTKPGLYTATVTFTIV